MTNASKPSSAPRSGALLDEDEPIARSIENAPFAEDALSLEEATELDARLASPLGVTCTTAEMIERTARAGQTQGMKRRSSGPGALAHAGERHPASPSAAASDVLTAARSRDEPLEKSGGVSRRARNDATPADATLLRGEGARPTSVENEEAI